MHVAELASGLTRLGHEVVVYTRRDDADLPETVRTDDGYDVVHLDAGPARRGAQGRPLAADAGLRRRAAPPPPYAHGRRRARALLDVRLGRDPGDPRPRDPDLRHVPRPRLGQAAPPGQRRHQPARARRRRAGRRGAGHRGRGHVPRRGGRADRDGGRPRPRRRRPLRRGRPALHDHGRTPGRPAAPRAAPHRQRRPARPAQGLRHHRRGARRPPRRRARRRRRAQPGRDRRARAAPARGPGGRAGGGRPRPLHRPGRALPHARVPLHRRRRRLHPLVRAVRPGAARGHGLRRARRRLGGRRDARLRRRRDDRRASSRRRTRPRWPPPSATCWPTRPGATAYGRAGVRRARSRYSWDAVATATAEVYEEALVAGAAPKHRASLLPALGPA